MRKILALLIIVVLVVVVLFYVGFWRADVQEGSLPKVDVDVSAEGGSLPRIDVDSKELVVGTREREVEVPTVKTENRTIEVPVVGTRDNGEE